MTVKLLTEQHFEFLNLTGGCTGLSESTLAKMPHCWKSHVTSQMSLLYHINEIKFLFELPAHEILPHMALLSNEASGKPAQMARLAITFTT